MKKIIKCFVIFVSFLFLFSVFFTAGCGCQHEWTLESTTATCVNSGIDTYKCKLCGKIKTEKADNKPHNYETITITSPTCTTPGTGYEKCSVCGQIGNTITIEACGHNYQHRVCTNCNYSPLQQFTFAFSLNSVGGINVNSWITNTSNKRIKYIRYKAYLKNNVGDLIRDNIKNKNYIDVECIGYFEIGVEVQVISREVIGYCKNCARIDIPSIEITYEDNTVEKVANNYYYI